MALPRHPVYGLYCRVLAWREGRRDRTERPTPAPMSTQETRFRGAAYGSAGEVRADWRRQWHMPFTVMVKALAESGSFFDGPLFDQLFALVPGALRNLSWNPTLSPEAIEWIRDRCVRLLTVDRRAVVRDHAAHVLEQLLKDGRVAFTPDVTGALIAYLHQSIVRGRDSLIWTVLADEKSPAELLDALAPSPDASQDYVVDYVLGLLTHPNGGARHWPAFHDVLLRLTAAGYFHFALAAALLPDAPTEHFPLLWHAVHQANASRAMELLCGRPASDIRRLGLSLEAVRPHLESQEATVRAGAFLALGALREADATEAGPVAGTGAGDPMGESREAGTEPADSAAAGTAMAAATARAGIAERERVEVAAIARLMAYGRGERWTHEDRTTYGLALYSPPGQG